MKGAILHGVINSSAISIHITEKAMTYMDEIKQPIYVGMELYFTYFMQKKVVFSEVKPDFKVTKITDQFYMYFKVLQARRCKLKDLKGDSRDLIDMPVTRKGALVPKYILIDYKKGKWVGDYTWKSGNSHLQPVILNYN